MKCLDILTENDSIVVFNAPTPVSIPSSVIDYDLMDTVDFGQVYPPGGGTFIDVRYSTLFSPDTQV